jgi:hypothetical protein
MTSIRSSRSGVTGAEILVYLAVAGLVAWIGGPRLKSWKQSREIAKQERKIDKNEAKTDQKQAGATAEDQSQLRAGHEYVAATGDAIAAIPPEHQTPASELAKDLNKRADSALSAGRNQDLTPQQRQAMEEIVRLALSPLAEENAKANATLAAKSIELNKSVDNEAKLRAEITKLEGEKAILLQEKEVIVQEKLALAARLEWWIYWGKIVVSGYIGLAWILPGAAKFFPALAPFARGGRWLVDQAGAAASSTLTATVKGVDGVRKRLKESDVPAELRKEIDKILSNEIYDSHAARVDEIRRQEKLV